MQPTNHAVTLTNRYGNRITAPVVHVQDLGPKGLPGRAEVHIEVGYANAATYTTPSSEAADIFMRDKQQR